jgi:hypothetical protein
MDNPFPLITKIYQAILCRWHLWVSPAKDEDTQKKPMLSIYAIAKLTSPPTTHMQCGLPIGFPLAEFETSFIGREEQLSQLKQSLDSWQEGQGELTCIVAPFGSGLSSLLSVFISSQKSGIKIGFMSFYQAPLSPKEAIAQLYACFNINQAPDSITQAIKLIKQQPAQVIVLDNLHKLMVRLMGNYQALVTLATILMETRSQHCWIFGCETFAWQRLTSQYQINNYIKSVIKIDYFSLNETTELINQYFNELELLTTEEDIERRQQACKQIHMTSSGQPKLAKLLLLDAIKLDDSQNIYFSEISELDSDSLKQCNDDDLFTLAEVYVHGGLSVSQHSDIFTTSIERSSLKLEQLNRQGMLSAQYSPVDFAAHKYAIPPCLTKIVANHLVNNNKLFK